MITYQRFMMVCQWSEVNSEKAPRPNPKEKNEHRVIQSASQSVTKEVTKYWQVLTSANKFLQETTVR